MSAGRRGTATVQRGVPVLRGRRWLSISVRSGTGRRPDRPVPRHHKRPTAAGSPRGGEHRGQRSRQQESFEHSRILAEVSVAAAGDRTRGVSGGPRRSRRRQNLLVTFSFSSPAGPSSHSGLNLPASRSPVVILRIVWKLCLFNDPAWPRSDFRLSSAWCAPRGANVAHSHPRAVWPSRRLLAPGRELLGPSDWPEPSRHISGLSAVVGMTRTGGSRIRSAPPIDLASALFACEQVPRALIRGGVHRGRAIIAAIGCGPARALRRGHLP
jgi:hypothetical protein